MSEKEKKAKKEYKDRLTKRKAEAVTGLGAIGEAAASAATDPYLSRNEFKPGFYDQKDKPPITAETMYGKGTTRTLESPMIDPDTSMMQGMAEGGSVRGQKAIQVKKKPFRGIF